jgi:hypothetical protein
MYTSPNDVLDRLSNIKIKECPWIGGHCKFSFGGTTCGLEQATGNDRCPYLEDENLEDKS